MRGTVLVTGAFALGFVAGVVAAVTLRHELWPLASRVGILKLYAAMGTGLFILFAGWYLNLQRHIRRTLERPVAQVLFSTINFLLALLLLAGAFILGLFFVALH
jgi:hypothetical protein